MIFFKIIAILLATGAGLLQIGLEYRWHDKRKKKHKRVRFFLILLMVLGFLTASILVIYDDLQSGKQIQTLTELKNSAVKAAKNAEKRELKDIEDRERIKEDLNEIQEQIKPVVKLATEKYPTLGVKNALVKLADDVQGLQKQNKELQRQTKKLSVRDFFHPLDTGAKNIVYDRLNQIQESLGNRDIQISIVWQIGNTKRQLVAKELVTIFSDCGFNTSGPDSISTFSSRVLPAVEIKTNPADIDIARKFARSLQPFLNLKFTVWVIKKYEIGKVNIAIYGNPMFSEDGSVTFP